MVAGKMGTNSIGLFIRSNPLSLCCVTEPQSFIGVNYGQAADNLPPPAATANLLKSTTIGKVRLDGADGAIIKALAGTGIEIVIGAANSEIPTLASDLNSATAWVNSNVVPYYPASNITLITVGNEVMITMDHGLISQLLPAMRNVQKSVSWSNGYCRDLGMIVEYTLLVGRNCRMAFCFKIFSPF